MEREISMSTVMESKQPTMIYKDRKNGLFIFLSTGEKYIIRKVYQGPWSISSVSINFMDPTA